MDMQAVVLQSILKMLTQSRRHFWLSSELGIKLVLNLLLLLVETLATTTTMQQQQQQQQQEELTTIQLRDSRTELLSSMEDRSLVIR